MSDSDHSQRSAHASVASILSLITENEESLAEARTRMADVRGYGTAADGRVIAEALPSGAPIALSIDPRAMRLGAEDLAQEILSAIQDAGQDASDQAAELMEPYIDELMGMSDWLNNAPAGSEDDGLDIERVLAELRDVRRRFGA